MSARVNTQEVGIVGENNSPIRLRKDQMLKVVRGVETDR